ncbi:MAG: hypothetical protein N2487_03360 [Verrucomicrobiae bacterium]|nr:hypothetical protein [Verrucomicrobiae bacterium]
MGVAIKYKWQIVFFAVTLLCSVAVIRQMESNKSRHIELREAFILLHSRGYTNEAQKLFNKLLDEIPKLSDTQLIDDFQRTLNLVDPTIPHSSNLIWVYHWTVSNELEKRSASNIRKALKLANE